MNKSEDRNVFIFNLAPLYRKKIYCAIDEQFKGSPIYFGDKLKGNIKQLDTSILKNFSGKLSNTYIYGNFYWQRGLLSLFFKPYKRYIMTGDVHCISNYILWFFIKLHPKKKLIIWGHGCYGRESWLRFLFVRLTLWLCNGYMCYGNFARNILKNKGIKADKLTTIYNSLDYDTQRMFRDKMVPKPIFKEHFGNDHTNLIFIGRLTETKSLDMLLKSQSELSRRGVNVNITFIGDGQAKEMLTTLANELKVANNVWFYGACHDEETISELMYNADICISPGNVGLTAMHAMMYGCPVITHNDGRWQMPEFEAVIPGVTGDYFEYNNISSLTDKVGKWIENNTNKRDIIRQNCFREIDSKWNPRNQIELITDFINNI